LAGRRGIALVLLGAPAEGGGAARAVLPAAADRAVARCWRAALVSHLSEEARSRRQRRGAGSSKVADLARTRAADGGRGRRGAARASDAHAQVCSCCSRESASDPREVERERERERGRVVRALLSTWRRCQIHYDNRTAHRTVRRGTPTGLARRADPSRCPAGARRARLRSDPAGWCRGCSKSLGGASSHNSAAHGASRARRPGGRTGERRD
jgi:hypothetical protein